MTLGLVWQVLTLAFSSVSEVKQWVEEHTTGMLSSNPIG
jgi:hypothetical protein